MSGDGPSADVTRMLERLASGDARVPDELFPLVYDELRAIARSRMAGERADHTLEATALVHEAYLKLVGPAGVPWAGRAQFYFAAADAMRRILIDHARAKGSEKRGGGRVRDVLSVADLVAEPDFEKTMALDEAVSRLEERDPRAAEVVRLRFYAGLDVDEAARALGVSARTVKREWAYARAWLLEELNDDTQE